MKVWSVLLAVFCVIVAVQAGCGGDDDNSSDEKTNAPANKDEKGNKDNKDNKGNKETASTPGQKKGKVLTDAERKAKEAADKKAKEDADAADKKAKKEAEAAAKATTTTTA